MMIIPDKKMIEVKYTEKEKELIKEMDEVDARIDKIKKEYSRESKLKYPKNEKLKNMENEVGFLIKHRNEISNRLYGG